MASTGSGTKTKRAGITVGWLSVFLHLLLWMIFFSRAGGASDVLFSASVLIGAPLLCAVIALLSKKALLMYAAFLGAIPMALYLFAAEGIFPRFGWVALFYLASAVLLSAGRR